MAYAKFDFHLHTQWSYDGTAEVESYFKLARERGLEWIAVTEHNNVDSREEALACAARYPDVGYIPGVEFSVHTPFGNIDMVSLGVPEKLTPELERVFQRYLDWSHACGQAMSQLMQSGGFDYSDPVRLELLRRYRPEKALRKQGLTHAQGRIERTFFVEDKHWFATMEECTAFINARKSVLPAAYPEFDTVLPAAKAAGMLIGIAHPTKYFLTNDLKRMDALREMLGFEMIECAHDSVPHELTPFYRDYCKKHHLFSSGGSDNHSFPGQPYRVGERHEFARHIGEESWCAAILERLGKR